MDAAAIRRAAHEHRHHSFDVAEEHHSICSITRRCASQSRGFTIETPESLSAWTEGPNNALVVAQAGARST